ncbi:endothelial cell-selective adhesion molecule-like [Amphibalanus amphitrite]|uniref:endothelial cell-selective adhesion molecule-like n=2 Tax=Amphibalanus amphitrite TaxID=1232801 RepID=UPI001C902457|nr:endothelial cell-selective adhesion molecule-like [Amphibalanus amphitrite]
MVVLSVLLASLCCLPAGEPLRMVNSNIPVYKQVGEETTLLCDYDLEGDSLYSVKWYKDDVEFYRYMPKNNPAKLVYPDMPGIDVDTSRSDETRVTLLRLDMSSTGRYRCEVSAEAPNFDTVNSKGTMVVIVLPEEDPIISGQDEVYTPGSHITLNCTSERSKPAAQLMWFINEREVGEEHLVPYGIVMHPDGLETSILGLHVPLRPHAFRSGQIQLKCVAYIKAFNYASSTTDVIASYGQIRDNLVQQRQASFLVKGAASRMSHSTTGVLFLLLTTHAIIQ